MKPLYKKLYLVCFFLLLLSMPAAMACTTCNRPLQAAIFDDSFPKLFLLMVLPFILTWIAVARLHKLK